MVLAGTFDRYYYHEVEITFLGIRHICMPTDEICIDNFRLATQEEIYNLKTIISDYGQYLYVIFLEDTYSDTRHYVVADGMECNWVIVYYYNRENLKSD